MTQVSGKTWGQDRGVSPSNPSNTGHCQAGNQPQGASEAWLSPLGLERSEQLNPWLWHSLPPLFFYKVPSLGFWATLEPPALGGPWRTAAPELGAVTSALELCLTTTECMGELGARGKTPPQTAERLQRGTHPGVQQNSPAHAGKGSAIHGIAAVPALITAPRHPGLLARASAGENKPWGRNPALRPGLAARLLRGKTKREAQLTLSEAYALPNESRPRSYAGVAPIPRQASTPPRANTGARQPPRKETGVGNFPLMLAGQPAPAPGRRTKDCRRSPRSPACAYTWG